MQHWRIEWRKVGGEKHCLCKLDVDYASATPSPVNKLSEPVFRELGACIVEAERAKVNRLILASAKPAGFCVGTDIALLEEAGIELAEELEEAHRVIDRLDFFPGAVVAIIDGHCFDGGLELALACDYRIATPEACFAFPEVTLGLHPGLGASWRLPRRIAIADAFDMMLSGRMMTATAALHSHLVDELVPGYMLETAAGRCRIKTASRLDRLKNRSLEMRPVRTIIAAAIRRQLHKRINEDHYPAPYALLDVWQHDSDKKEMLFVECASFVELALSERVKNLLRVFRLREQLKAKARSLGQTIGANQLSAADHIHVLGAGPMGSDIATWVALQGYRVSLYDPDKPQIARAIAAAATFFQETDLPVTGGDRCGLNRLIPDPNNDGLINARLIIEAVPEKLILKQHALAEVAQRARPDAIIATTTASLALEQLAFAEPERLVGLHFFQPVAAMPLVEVVYGEQTDPTTVAVASAFAEGIKKLPLPVKSRPGFLVNRVLMPYLLEAMLLYDEGYPAEDIDAAAENFGMRQGPLQLADRMGLDSCLDVINHLSGILPSGSHTPDGLRRLIDAGNLGSKTGRGFFSYTVSDTVDSHKKGTPQIIGFGIGEPGAPIKKGKASESIPESIQNRLNLALLNSAVACWREKIVASEDELDAGLIFGAGFAPFRGGPMHYLRASNEQSLLKTLQSLAQEHPRFKPDEGWRSLAA